MKNPLHMFCDKDRFNLIYGSIIGLTLFLLCLLPNLAPIGIALLTIHTIIGYLNKNISFKFNYVSALLVLLYFIFVIGLFFTSDVSEGLKGLEYKLSLVLIPLLTMVRFNRPLVIAPVYVGLIIGCLAGSLFGIFKGVTCYQSSQNFNCFLSSNISTIIHPTYFSAYVVIAIVCLWSGFKSKLRFFTLINCLILTAYFVCYTFMMMSLAGMIFILLLAIAVFFLFCYQKFRLKGVLFMLIVSPIFLFGTYKFVPQVHDEIEDLMYYGCRYVKNSDAYFESLYYPYSGTESRLIMWRISIEQIMEQPFGVGTGGVDDALAKRMYQKQLDNEFIERKLNPHNQYLQFFIEIGFVGVGVFVVFICTLIYQAWQRRNFLLLILSLNFALNCMFESMLQRQSGIMFYTLLFCVCLILSEKKLRNEKV